MLHSVCRAEVVVAAEPQPYAPQAAQTSLTKWLDEARHLDGNVSKAKGQEPSLISPNSPRQNLDHTCA